MISIKKAGNEHLSAIYNLVKELAVYEKEPDAVTTTLSEYENSLNSGDYEALVLLEEDIVIGMALYFIGFSTWTGKMIHLEDFIITQTKRQSGLGQILFDALLEHCKSEKIKCLRWQVLDWNNPAIMFYKKNKAQIEQNWLNCKIVVV